MKIISISAIFLFMFQMSFGQAPAAGQAPASGKSNDESRINLTVYIPEQISKLSPEAKSVIKDKLNKIVTKNGVGGSGADGRFVITANVTEDTKDVTPTTPVMYAYTLNITLYIGDGVSGTLFNSTSISVKGMDRSETKAYLTALREFNPNTKDIATFVEEGKKKIIEYYSTQCDFILKDAQTMAGQNKFDEAIFKLCEVPTVCKVCYDKCMDKIPEYYKAKINRECQQLLANAKVLKTQDNFDEAASLLAPILPDMSCYNDAQKLLKEINDHRCAVSLGKAKGAWASKNIDETSTYLSEIPSDSKCAAEAQKIADEVRVWAKEKDNREWKFELQKQKDATAIQKASIKAARDIGVAYGRNQPKTVYKVYWW